MIGKGITFNGKHTFNDLGLTLVSKEIGNPSKIKKIITIPYTNIEYDMSELYGSQSYENRVLKYEFNVIDRSNYQKDAMNLMKINALNDLMSLNQKGKLLDDDIPGFYFLAEIRNAPSFVEKRGHGLLTLEFTAYPFKISEKREGDDVWDTFCFITDVAQQYKYFINGRDTFIIINKGVSGLMPKIIASSEMKVTLNGQLFAIPAGESQSLDFRFETGKNKLLVIGQGTIEFLWFKEVL